MTKEQLQLIALAFERVGERIKGDINLNTDTPQNALFWVVDALRHEFKHLNEITAE